MRARSADAPDGGRGRAGARERVHPEQRRRRGRATPGCCSSMPASRATRWPPSRTTFAPWASRSWRASRRIPIGTTCSGTPRSATRPATARPAARHPSAEVLAAADWQAEIAEELPPEVADDVPMELLGLITGLPAGTVQVPWNGPSVRIIEHRAHSVGHAALLIEERRVLIAGDMLSDVLIPMLDLQADDPIADYLAALQLLEAVAGGVDVVVPGHGSVGGADQLRARIDQDRAYVQALRDARGSRRPADRRIGQARMGMGERRARLAAGEPRAAGRARRSALSRMPPARFRNEWSDHIAFETIHA